MTKVLFHLILELYKTGSSGSLEERATASLTLRRSFVWEAWPFLIFHSGWLLNGPGYEWAHHLGWQLEHIFAFSPDTMLPQNSCSIPLSPAWYQINA